MQIYLVSPHLHHPVECKGELPVEEDLHEEGEQAEAAARPRRHVSVGVQVQRRLLSPET